MRGLLDEFGHLDDSLWIVILQLNSDRISALCRNHDLGQFVEIGPKHDIVEPHFVKIFSSTGDNS